MKTTATLFFILTFTTSATFAQNQDANFYSAKGNKDFIENKGQIVDQNDLPNTAVKYLLCSPGLNVQLRDNGFSYDTYTITRNTYAIGTVNDKHLEEEENVTYNFHRVDISFPGSNPSTIIEATEASTDYMNYYTVGTPQEGVTNVHHYKKVTYKNLYPKIDLEFNAYSKQDRPVEYNFIVYPGGDANMIKIKYAGAQSSQLRDGKIKLQLQTGDLYETMPLAYQTDESKTVNVFYKQTGNNEYGIVCDNFNPSETLTIDPFPHLVWGTYLGGAEHDDINDITYNYPSVYVGGHAASSDNIATFGSYQSYIDNSYDAIFARFEANGNLTWCSYYGGSGYDDIHGVACYGDFIYLSGRTSSTTVIATPVSYQNSHSSSGLYFNGFLGKFTNTGTRLWATYFGWNGVSCGNMVTCDNVGNVYMSGYAASADTIASAGAYQTSLGGAFGNADSCLDAYLVSFTENGVKRWGTYYGDNNYENAVGVYYDPAGYIYMAGETASPNGTHIADSNAQQSVYGGGDMDGFLVKFDLNGNRMWGTYYGGNGYDNAHSVTGDAYGNIYITGGTYSNSSISTMGPKFGYKDAYIVRFNSNGQRIWGQYFGGTTDSEEGQDIICDNIGYIYTTGFSRSTDLLTTPGAHQVNSGGGKDAFLVKFNPTGNGIWCTYYGGSNDDETHALTLDNFGDIYICGATKSSDNISTPGAYDETYSSAYDCFVAKFNELTPLPVNLINFTAKATKDNFVLLQWTTATENNNDYFTVEHSTDALHFTEVTKIKGAGNNNIIHHYSALDKNPESGINYYRLKQTDLNGAFTYSATVAVMISTSENAVVLFPNPSPTGAFQFALPQEIKGEGTISAYNLLGEIIIKEKINVDNNSTLNLMNLEKFPSGLYCLIIEIEGIQFVTRAIKQ